MKTRIFLPFFIASMLVMLPGCYEDKSSEWGERLPVIEIDTTGIAQTHRVKQYGTLKIDPRVSREGAVESDFSYKWMLNRVAHHDIDDTDPNLSQYVCIGEEMALDAEIELSPNTETYFLWYQVTDNTTGLRKDIVWNVHVESALGEGLLVAETRDGTTTDFSLIESSSIKEGYTDDPNIIRNVYSRKNGAAFDGLITQIATSYNSVLQRRRFYCITNDSYALIDGVEYELEGMNHQVMFDTGIPLSPSQIFLTPTDAIVLVTGGRLYPFYYSRLFDYPAIVLDNTYTRRSDNAAVSYELDRMVSYVYEGGRRSASWGMMYDKKNSAFLYSATSADETRKFMAYPVNAAYPFDPNNAPGLETQYAAMGRNEMHHFVMKNTATGAYEIYVFISASTNKPQGKHTVPAETKLGEAVGYAVAQNAPVVYFATRTEVYAIILGLPGSVPQVKHIYTVPNGEITSFCMFRQAWYLREPDMYISGTGYRKPMPTHENLLLLGVSEGNTGEIHALPITAPATATVDAGSVEIYNGFGRILTMTAQE